MYIYIYIYIYIWYCEIVRYALLVFAVTIMYANSDILHVINCLKTKIAREANIYLYHFLSFQDEKHQTLSSVLSVRQVRILICKVASACNYFAKLWGSYHY